MAAIEAEITKAKHVVLTNKARHESAIADLEAAMPFFYYLLAAWKAFSQNCLDFLVLHPGIETGIQKDPCFYVFHGCY